MKCLSKSDLNMNLRGVYYADVFEYIEIKLELCPQYGGSECASPTEINDFFQEFAIAVSFSNNSFDLKS